MKRSRVHIAIIISILSVFLVNVILLNIFASDDPLTKSRILLHDHYQQQQHNQQNLNLGDYTDNTPALSAGSAVSSIATSGRRTYDEFLNRILSRKVSQSHVLLVNTNKSDKQQQLVDYAASKAQTEGHTLLYYTDQSSSSSRSAAAFNVVSNSNNYYPAAADLDSWLGSQAEMETQSPWILYSHFTDLAPLTSSEKFLTNTTTTYLTFEFNLTVDGHRLIEYYLKHTLNSSGDDSLFDFFATQMQRPGIIKNWDELETFKHGVTKLLGQQYKVQILAADQYVMSSRRTWGPNELLTDVNKFIVDCVEYISKHLVEQFRRSFKTNKNTQPYHNSLEYDLKDGSTLDSQTLTFIFFATQGLDLAIPSRYTYLNAEFICNDLNHIFDNNGRCGTYFHSSMNNLTKPCSLPYNSTYTASPYELVFNGSFAAIVYGPKQSQKKAWSMNLNHIKRGTSKQDIIRGLNSFVDSERKKEGFRLLDFWSSLKHDPALAEAFCVTFSEGIGENAITPVPLCQTRILPNRKKSKVVSSKNSTSSSIISLLIDPLSSTQFSLLMPKTKSFLEDHGFVQMKKYTAVGPNSGKNQNALFRGVPLDSRHGIKSTITSEKWIWDTLSVNGYKTLKLENNCILNSNMVQSMKPKVDHGEQLYELFCYSFTRPNCLGSRTTASWTLQYAAQFLEAYSSNVTIGIKGHRMLQEIEEKDATDTESTSTFQNDVKRIQAESWEGYPEPKRLSSTRENQVVKKTEEASPVKDKPQHEENIAPTAQKIGTELTAFLTNSTVEILAPSIKSGNNSTLVHEQKKVKKKLVRKRKIDPFAMFLSFTDSHEDTSTLVNLLDEIFVKFLNDTMSMLDETFIVVSSDHGLHYGPYFQSFPGERERANPVLFIRPPRNFNSTALISNQQKYVTPFDLYQTFLDIAQVPVSSSSVYGESLLREITSDRMSCSSMEQIPPEFCHLLENKLDNSNESSSCTYFQMPPSVLSFFSDIDENRKPTWPSCHLNRNITKVFENAASSDGTRSTIESSLTGNEKCATNIVDWGDCTKALLNESRTFTMVDYDGGDSKGFSGIDVDIHIKREESIIDAYNEVRKNSSFVENGIPLSIMIIELDSVSKQHAERHLNRVSNLLSKHSVSLNDFESSRDCVDGICALNFNNSLVSGKASIENQLAALSGCVFRHDLEEDKGCFDSSDQLYNSHMCLDAGKFQLGAALKTFCLECPTGTYLKDPFELCVSDRKHREFCCTKDTVYNKRYVCKDKQSPVYGMHLLNRHNGYLWCPILSSTNNTNEDREHNNEHKSSSPWIYDLVDELGYLTFFGEEFCYGSKPSQENGNEVPADERLSPYVIQDNYFPVEADFHLDPLFCRLAGKAKKDKGYAKFVAKWSVEHDSAMNPQPCVGRRGDGDNAKSRSQFGLEYIMRLWSAYYDVPKFSYLNALAAHEYSLDPAFAAGGLEHYDEYLEGFLKVLFSSDLLSNTILFLRSDHGLQGGPRAVDYSTQMEHPYPWNNIIFPQKFLTQTIVANQHRMITSYDLYKTMINLLPKNSYKGANSNDMDDEQEYQSRMTGSKWSFDLFHEEVTESRTCKDAMVPPHFCPCMEVRGDTLSPQFGVRDDPGYERMQYKKKHY